MKIYTRVLSGKCQGIILAILIGLLGLETGISFLFSTTARARDVLDLNELECQNLADGVLVATRTGIREAAIVCQEEIAARSDRDDSPAKVSHKEQIRWGKPYWKGSNICRDRIDNVVCLTPQAAKNLRWPVP